MFRDVPCSGFYRRPILRASALVSSIARFVEKIIDTKRKSCQLWILQGQRWEIVYRSWHMQQRARGSYHGKNENHICELRSEEELYEGRSSQLYIYTQLLQLRKDSLKKKIRLVRDSNPWPVRYRCSTLPIVKANKPTGSRLLN